MENPMDIYWHKRLYMVQENLKKNNFAAYVCKSSEEAKTRLMQEIIPPLQAKTIGFGGSTSLQQTGIFDAVCKLKNVDVLRSDLPELSPEEKIEVRRQSLLVDLFLTGTNALLEDGALVNLDMIGNRVAALTFGPKNVIVVLGRNKIASDLDTAMLRIKNYACPVNSIRLNMKTPCALTTECTDCSTPTRICNTWTIHEKSFPQKRVIVVLVNEDLGF